MEVINTTGRRKKSVARIYMVAGKGEIVVNNKPVEQYFPTEVLQIIVKQAFEFVESADAFDIKVNVKGGGVSGQHLMADIPAGRMGEGKWRAEEVGLGAEGGEAQ